MVRVKAINFLESLNYSLKELGIKYIGKKIENNEEAMDVILKMNDEFLATRHIRKMAKMIKTIKKIRSKK